MPKMEQNDDRHESPRDIPHGQLLHDTFALCRDTVEVGYRQADASALRHQRYHRLLTITVAIFGTTAVLLTIVQLSGLFPGDMVAAAIRHRRSLCHNCRYSGAGFTATAQLASGTPPS